jgi:hypothetical protein
VCGRSAATPSRVEGQQLSQVVRIDPHPGSPCGEADPVADSGALVEEHVCGRSAATPSRVVGQQLSQVVRIEPHPVCEQGTASEESKLSTPVSVSVSTGPTSSSGLAGTSSGSHTTSTSGSAQTSSSSGLAGTSSGSHSTSTSGSGSCETLSSGSAEYSASPQRKKRSFLDLVHTASPLKQVNSNSAQQSILEMKAAMLSLPVPFNWQSPGTAR